MVVYEQTSACAAAPTTGTDYKYKTKKAGADRYIYITCDICEDF